MIVVNKMEKPQKKEKENDEDSHVYVDYVLRKENMLKLLKLNPKNEQKRERIQKNFKNHAPTKSIFVFDVSKEKECNEFFEEVAKRINDED
jgi:hypothetical protein